MMRMPPKVLIKSLLWGVGLSLVLVVMAILFARGPVVDGGGAQLNTEAAHNAQLLQVHCLRSMHK